MLIAKHIIRDKFGDTVRVGTASADPTISVTLDLCSDLGGGPGAFTVVLSRKNSKLLRQALREAEGRKPKGGAA